MIQVLSMNLCTKCCVHVRYMYEIKEHNIRVSQTEFAEVHMYRMLNI